ncbi:MAG: hypothetical protein COV43_03190 [Deltaproteobacteria bacterium CG11_big_fil_rev_8_21_14_0_20_42_23]|nr:MAG: hypothetical protein COV43_03190 [Deltaproteobacteria bacterium CG11_big_fil_rev_8_21_14_0_20_42_23]PJC63782.1 MAG: hypothetical protein CO021_07805 [Deltaproteobacteria bacterium CG_4_9_14_0_2_um_filter_42_21]
MLENIKKKKKHHETNWSEVVAKPKVKAEPRNEKEDTLLVPRFRSGLLKKVLQPRLSSPYIKVKLDEYGTFIWRQIEAEKSFADMIAEIKKQYGSDFVSPEERTQQFLKALLKRDLIALYTSREGE